MSRSRFNRRALEAIQKSRLDLGEKKNHDYSLAADGIAIAGLHGLAVRMLDKALRILSLTTPGVDAKVKDESIRDTLLDMGNYADYGVSLLDGTWGKPDAQLDKNA